LINSKEENTKSTTIREGNKEYFRKFGEFLSIFAAVYLSAKV